MTNAHDEVTRATEEYITNLLQESLLFEDSLQSTITQLQRFPLELVLKEFLNQYTLHSVQAKQQLESLICTLGIELSGKSTRLFDLIWQGKSRLINTAESGGADFLLSMLIQQLSFLKVANFTTLCIYYRSVSNFAATELNLWGNCN